MRRLVALVTLLALLSPLALAARTGEQTYLPGIVIFKLKDQPAQDGKALSTGSPKVDAVLQGRGIRELRQLFPAKMNSKTPSGKALSRICQAGLPRGADVKAICRELLATGQVEYAEPRYGYQVEATVPNDPQFGSQWFLAKIQAPQAWDISTGDPAVAIGIVDCGIQLGHPDLAANLWYNPGEAGALSSNGVDDDGNGYIDDYVGWDFCGPDTATFAPDNDPNVYGSNNDHGTHVAGDASAVTNNATGVAGIGWSCRVMAIKCSFDNDTRAPGGKGYIYYGYDGMVYAADNGAEVINCSWGGSGYSQFGQELVTYAWDHGAVVVCAAGNENSPDPHYPSAYDNALSVAATTSSDLKSSFSNYGTTVDVSAPGSSILSTAYSNTYASWNGTSMASPVAAGTAGLIWAHNPGWNNTQVATQLVMTTDDINSLNPSYAGLLGSGRINAYKALTTAPVPLVKYHSHLIYDGGNGIAEAGETVSMLLSLKNWWGDAASVTATIHSDDYAVSITSGYGSFGALEGGAIASNAGFAFSVDNTALPHRAAFMVEVTADAQVRTDTFYVQIERSPILLVDDDTGARNVDTCYTKSISNLGYFYDRYDRSRRGAPDTSLLKSYDAVIWLCEWAFPSLDSLDRAALRTYLDRGGSLYLSGQDIGWDLADPTGLPDNQYTVETAGFYQDYLHADYGGDHSGISSVVGRTGDPIGDGLSFSIYQPYISTAQYYDYFNPRAGADYSLSYSGFSTGRAGIAYSGAHKLFYTGFGFEAITSTSARDTLMDRVIRYFLGDIQIAHSPLGDTEDTLNPYLVQATVTSGSGVGPVYLYWDDDGALPFANRSLMVGMGGGVYQGSIPAHQGARIDYFIYAANSNGLNKTLPGGAPYSYYSFYAGPDPFLPEIVHAPLLNTINLAGPYRVAARITDNYGVFPDSAYVRYRVNSGAEYPAVQLSASGDDFSGWVTLPAHIYTGDTVNYYLTAVDQSSQRNIGRSPAAGYHSFVMADSVLVSNFDSPGLLAVFDTLAGTSPWRTYTTQPRSAPNCLRSGSANYANGAQITLQLKPEHSYNLDAYADNNNWVMLYLWIKGIISTTPGDTVFLEASQDGLNWTTLKFRTSLTTAWSLDSALLNPVFSGPGSNDSILFRMRLQTDAAANAFGWLVDDVFLKVQPFPSGTGGGPAGRGPALLALDQNRPNPFRSRTAISYQLPAPGRIRLGIYNISGQLVKTLVDARQSAGLHSASWDGRDNSGRRASAGVYIYRLSTDSGDLTGKMVLLR